MAELTLSFATGLLWLLVFAGVVLFIGRVLPEERGPVLLAAFPVFFGIQVLLAIGLGTVGLLTTTVFVSFYALLLVLAVAYWLRTTPRGRVAPTMAAADPDTLLIRRIVLGVTVVVLAGLALYTLVTPVYVWDVLSYHMPMIASYVQNGSLEAWPTQDLRQIYRVNAGELQMLNVALLARSDVWVELPNLLAFGVCLVATYEIARLADLPQRWCYAAVALVLTAPQIVVGAGTAKNDLIFTAALLCAFYWFLRGALSRRGGTQLPARQTYIPLILAGASAALAAATKVMGLNVLGALGLLGLVLVAKTQFRMRNLVVFVAAASVTLLLLAGDVYLGNVGRTAVPVGVAPGEIHFTIGLTNLIQAARYYLYELSFKRLVVPQVFEHDFLHYGYAFPFLLVLGIITAVRQLRSREFVLAALALAGVILVASIIAVRQPIRWDQRFMIWLVPTLAILAVANGRALAARYPVAVASATGTLALVNLVLMLTNEADGLFNRSALHLATTGQPARYIDVANQRYAEMNDGFEVLERTAAPRDSVLYAGAEDTWMYLAWGPRFTRHVEGVWNAEHAASQLAGGRFRFVVVEDATPKEIREVLVREAAVNGYTLLVRGNARTIFVRHLSAAEG